MSAPRPSRAMHLLLRVQAGFGGLALLCAVLAIVGAVR